ncbi:hypothetical protein MIND_00532100 [Mycena indigotica]|uniref:Gti1/Pac2 family-domain-containing protein n=1 Tax=Mycena indigotica TaxID=2126181 RepID=A0A8H6SY98_9AGAR|nr:uncharacterized protein MIND_00532100 [Mycena indigotica]KAF7307380.1 hypothetical protein MIND_00532100 [Mycena indigotica]
MDALKSGPCFGSVVTSLDACAIIQQAVERRVPRILQRPTKRQLKSWLKSGAIFVFSPGESGIKRWTDGLAWSGSRAVGNFLVYHELEGYDSNNQGRQAVGNDDQSPKENLKLGGLIKKVFAINVEEVEYRVVSYYTVSDRLGGPLSTPYYSTMSHSLVDSMEFRLFDFAQLRAKIALENGKPSLRSNSELFGVESGLDPWHGTLCGSPYMINGQAEPAEPAPPSRGTQDPTVVLEHPRAKELAKSIIPRQLPLYIQSHNAIAE